MQPIKQQIIVTKHSLFWVIIRKLDFSCCSFDWFFPDRWAPVLTKSLRLVITPKLLKKLSLNNSSCCIWTHRNQCSQNGKKKIRQAEMEKRKTSVRLLTFLMFGMPLLNVVLCRENVRGRSLERRQSSLFSNRFSLKQTSASAPAVHTNPSSRMRKPCAERERTCRDVD